MANQISADGKGLEKLMTLIYETLKDNPLAEVLHDQKLPNLIGAKSQFDVLIKSKIARYDLLIAIECKDYKGPVDISAIHDFRGRCELVRGISRKIFVAVNGYQSGAKEVADLFGIELYNLSEISLSMLSGWIATSSITVSFPKRKQIGSINFYTIDGRKIVYAQEKIGPDFFLYEPGSSPTQLFYLASQVLQTAANSPDIIQEIKDNIDKEFNKINLSESGDELIITVITMFNFSGRRFGALLEGRLEELEKVGIGVEYIYAVVKPDNIVARAYQTNNGERVAETVSHEVRDVKFEMMKDNHTGIQKTYAIMPTGEIVEFKLIN